MQRRLVADWQARYGHTVLLLETFVDPQRFYGGVYRASNWTELGLTQGYPVQHHPSHGSNCMKSSQKMQRLYLLETKGSVTLHSHGL